MSLVDRHNPNKRCFAACPPGNYCECLGYVIGEREELEAFLKERDEALRTLDMDYARRLMPGASNDEVRLLALHKVRYEATSIEPELRHDSRAWMEKHGYKRFNDLPWSTDGSLPE